MTVELFAGEGSFRNMKGISQPRSDFTSHFAAAKWECGAAKWHSCAKGVFRSCKMVSQRVLGLRNEALDGFTGYFAVAKCWFGLRKGTRVPKRVVLRLQNGFAEGGMFRSKTSISQRGSLWLRNDFAGKAPFRRGAILAVKFLQAKKISLLLSSFGSLRASFTSSAIPPKFDHSKSLSYIKIT